MSISLSYKNNSKNIQLKLDGKKLQTFYWVKKKEVEREHTFAHFVNVSKKNKKKEINPA